MIDFPQLCKAIIESIATIAGIDVVQRTAYVLSEDLESMKTLHVEATPDSSSGAISTKDIYFDDFSVLVTIRQHVSASDTDAQDGFLSNAQQLLNRLRFQSLVGLPQAMFIGHQQQYAYNPEMLAQNSVMQTDFVVTYRVPSSKREWERTP